MKKGLIFILFAPVFMGADGCPFDDKGVSDYRVCVEIKTKPGDDIDSCSGEATPKVTLNVEGCFREKLNGKIKDKEKCSRGNLKAFQVDGNAPLFIEEIEDPVTGKKKLMGCGTLEWARTTLFDMVDTDGDGIDDAYGTTPLRDQNGEIVQEDYQPGFTKNFHVVKGMHGFQKLGIKDPDGSEAVVRENLNGIYQGVIPDPTFPGKEALLVSYSCDKFKDVGGAGTGGGTDVDENCYQYDGDGKLITGDDGEPLLDESCLSQRKDYNRRLLQGKLTTSEESSVARFANPEEVTLGQVDAAKSCSDFESIIQVIDGNDEIPTPGKVCLSGGARRTKPSESVAIEVEKPTSQSARQ